MYRNPTETYVCINNVWLDDIYRLDFTRDTTRAPLYGYRDKFYSRVDEGRHRVAGNIILNFTEPGYLTEAIRGIGNGIGIEESTDPYQRIEEMKLKLTAELQDIYIRYDPVSEINKRRNAIAELISWARRESLGDFMVDYIRNTFAPKNTSRNINTVVEPIDASPKHFDIQIYYGHPNKPGGRIEIIKKCALIGQSKTISAAASSQGDMSSSAQPIFEVYPFIGQRVVASVNPYDTMASVANSVAAI